MIDKVKNRKSNANSRKKRRFIRLELIRSFKQNRSCEICSESRMVCLDFHHRDKSKKRFNISLMLHDDYSLSRIREEISKCMVVCANCHRVLHFDDNGENTKRVDDEICPLFDF